MLLKGFFRSGMVLAAALAIGIIALLASIPYAMVKRPAPHPLGVSAERAIIANVNVLTMADPDILPRQFVRIEEGRIVSISAAPPDKMEDYASSTATGSP